MFFKILSLFSFLLCKVIKIAEGSFFHRWKNAGLRCNYSEVRSFRSIFFLLKISSCKTTKIRECSFFHPLQQVMLHHISKREIYFQNLLKKLTIYPPNIMVVCLNRIPQFWDSSLFQMVTLRFFFTRIT